MTFSSFDFSLFASELPALFDEYGQYITQIMIKLERNFLESFLVQVTAFLPLCKLPSKSYAPGFRQHTFPVQYITLILTAQIIIS